MASEENDSDDGKIVCGYLNKVESLGVIKSVKKRWYVLGLRSRYMYAYKNPRDTLPVGEIDIGGAVFTCDAANPKAFEIRTAKGQISHFEALDANDRVKWLDALQRCRAVQSASQPKAALPEDQIRYPHLKEFLQQVSSDAEQRSSIDRDEKSSVFYLTESGDVHDRSFVNANLSTETKDRQDALSPEAQSVIRWRSSPNRASFSGIDTAVSRVSAVLSKLTTKKPCETCTDLINVIQTLKERCINVNDELLANRDLVRVMQTNLLTYKNQIVLLQRFNEAREGIEVDETRNHVDETAVQFLLESEAAKTSLRLENSELKREVSELKARIEALEEDADRGRSEVDLLKTALKSKDETITSLVDSTGCVADAEAAIEDIPDFSGGEVQAFTETLVTDVATANANMQQEITKLKDLVQGYQTQNQFLNKEILELHQVVKNFEDKQSQTEQRLFEAQAYYYQLRSRYLLLLSHFQPNKELAPNVVAELLEDAKSNTVKPNGRYSFTDELGFYLTTSATDVSRIRYSNNPGGLNTDDPLLVTAGECKKFLNELECKHREETSEEYLSWLTRWDSVLVNFADKPIGGPCPDLKELIRSGVPHTYRSKVWKSLTQWWVKDEANDVGVGYFECLCKKTRSTSESNQLDGFDPALKQIDLDLTRTLPHNKYFEDMQAEKIEPLRRVLYAFRWHNRDVGYCQGLNRLAAVALLYLSEEDAFWCLAAIVEHLQPKEYYGHTMLVAQSDQRVLKDLVQEKMPKLSAHLRQANVDLSLFTFNWFLTIFVDSFPHKTFLNIWDCFLGEGNKVIFRFALAALKMVEPDILSCRTSGAVHACLSKMGERMTDYRKLAHIAFRELNPFPSRHIETRRQYHLQQLQAEFRSFSK